MQNIKKNLITFSKKIGISKIGICSAEPFYELKKIFDYSIEKGFNSGFEEKNLEKRIFPHLSLPDAKSIISIAIAYPSRANLQEDNKIRGKFSCSSWGKDYHLIVMDKLDKLIQYLKNIFPHMNAVAMVDTGPLSDRAVAVRAGLGWIGKNNNLVTEEFGSFVFLGTLVTNLPLPMDNPLLEKCKDCNLCQMACPMQAITEKRIINSQKCLAYLTQTKKNLSDKIKKKIAYNGYIYGCDVCQLVCPYNKKREVQFIAEFTPQIELINPALVDLLSISNKEFKSKYGILAGSWRGKKILQRNALYILGIKKDYKNIPFLKKVLLKDMRKEIKEGAAWALAQYGIEN